MGETRDDEWRHAVGELFGAYQDASDDLVRQVDYSLRLLAQAMLVHHAQLPPDLVDALRRYEASGAPIAPDEQ